MEPVLVTAPELQRVLEELRMREPIFHKQQFGTNRKDFEAMTADEFWEVGASGRRYSREFVLNTLDSRVADPSEGQWQTHDFHCLEIARDNFLLTYTLSQGGRQTRRSTIWRRVAEGSNLQVPESRSSRAIPSDRAAAEVEQSVSGAGG